MRTVAWDDIAAKAGWTTESFDELLETTTETPAELRARAAELRTQAEATDIDGYASAYTLMAARYEQAAAVREPAS